MCELQEPQQDTLRGWSELEFLAVLFAVGNASVAMWVLVAAVMVFGFLARNRRVLVRRFRVERSRP